MTTRSMSPEAQSRPVNAGDLATISGLHARVFGPGRFVRTAYRVRDGLPLVSPFCRVIVLGGEIIAALRFAPVTVGGVGRALMLGPAAVTPEHANLGYARRLIAEGHAAARDAGIRLVLLVGDEPYYGRLGFVRVPKGQMSMPGPVNPDRLLALELEAGALASYRGLIVGDAAATP
ncbi:MAG TPA: N-acetyltransferase [Hyphomicrobiaceae bacterium]|nr:N-acetyltransferase [Hyphomicrobiaceae bacterium]